ncbi:MAG TPA: hypothetical protein VK203_31520 [Nostocaceae cyanobacterium]|nr:hypothetical protein [Nostocaceae cyanobacterium]
MTSLTWYQRLQDLADNVAKDIALLKDFEDALHYEDDPRRKARYNREIKQLKESAKCYQQEYDNLKQQITNSKQSSEVQNLGVQLYQMNTKLNLILNSQVAISQNLNQMQQTLLARYDATQQLIISSVAQNLNQNQLLLTQTLLDALENNQLSETEIQQILVILATRIPALPSGQIEVADIIKNPELDAKHRLKIALPIIPFILDYEGELELGTGFNIKTVLTWVKSKLGIY